MLSNQLLKPSCTFSFLQGIEKEREPYGLFSQRASKADEPFSGAQVSFTNRSGTTDTAQKCLSLAVMVFQMLQGSASAPNLYNIRWVLASRCMPMCWQLPSIVAQSGIIVLHSASYILPVQILTIQSAPPPRYVVCNWVGLSRWILNHWPPPDIRAVESGNAVDIAKYQVQVLQFLDCVLAVVAVPARMHLVQRPSGKARDRDVVRHKMQRGRGK